MAEYDTDRQGKPDGTGTTVAGALAWRYGIFIGNRCRITAIYLPMLFPSDDLRSIC
jgi:hypothetical protein